ncbi:universal stress protein [Hymenobacter sp. BT188]|uniref:universal stress protein n=1 Tax=Hymenobacter sp. BT188 TaxID=2763504 RepID=UPI00165106DD|nr:universal stress protein [Hymenobacter sp. BT188]MBC6605893.1 universal stress protein [Hymenobacter sp. BT188]
MQPTFVVLTDMSAAAEVALTYTTRLAQLIHGRMVLLHVYLDPMLAPEAAAMASPITVTSRKETMAYMVQRAQELPVPAEAEIVLDMLSPALADVVKRHKPVLLAFGREEPFNLLDRMMGNWALPFLQQAQHPLLVVPEVWKDTDLPQRVLVATDDKAFWLSAPSLALTELMASLKPTTTVVHVAEEAGPSRADVGLASASRTGMFGHLTDNSLYEVCEEAPADGILHAAAELQAQLIVMLARPHTFLGGLFHHSVTADILRRSPVPVLVLPTTA